MAQKRASSPTSSSCPADLTHMPRSCSATDLATGSPAGMGLTPTSCTVGQTLGPGTERMSCKSALCFCPPPCVLCLGLALLLAAQWLQQVQSFHLSPHHPAWKSHLGALRDQKGGWDVYPSGQGHRLSSLRDSHPASSPSLEGSGCGSAEVGLEMETGSPSPCALGEDLPLTLLFIFTVNRKVKLKTTL